MARPIWTGSIAFGLVNIPIKIFSAIEESVLDLDMLDKRNHANIKYKRINEENGKEVAWNDVVKGYKMDGRYIILDEHDFEQAAAEKTKRIDILSFVKEAEIDPIYYDTTYFLGADKKEKRTYVLFREALIKSKMVGLGTYVLRNREHLGVIKVYKNALVLTKLHYENEIRDISDYDIPANAVKPSTAELKMAVSLIDQLSSPFDISEYKDEYTKQLLAFIKKKAKGKAPSPKASAKAIPKEADSLMEQLKASLASKKATSRRKKKDKSPS